MTWSPSTKDSTSFGNTGMTIPIASMSSRIVINTKMNAARRRGAASGVSVMTTAPASPEANAAWCAERSSYFLGTPGEWIFLLAQRQTDRRAGQIEGFAQTVDEISLIGIRHRVSAGAKNHKAGRTRFRL